ncbi:hypothetical protein [Orenia marismortui]|uniref:Uncharacterized protein n=1 Tax=Orenia marismortui TaxID=46469 RepID=A0A4R8GR79_9FIRM|nr:hypothetical protein [Orenia marismortui]TDX48308.1 hypothetical protein C7959_13035 [Orenia marismortui]
MEFILIEDYGQVVVTMSKTVLVEKQEGRARVKPSSSTPRKVAI